MGRRAARRTRGDAVGDRALGGTTPQQHFVVRNASKIGGALGPILTTIFAFLMAGVAVAVVGKDPLKVYRAIFDGTGLNFFVHFGSNSIRLPFSTQHVWFWWNTSSIAATNLQQTLLITTPIILHGGRARLRLPLRTVQHRRAGPVPRRLVLRRLDRLVVRPPRPVPARDAVPGDRRARRRVLRGDRRHSQGDGRRARGDHDDHAQLDGDLGRRMAVRPAGTAAEHEPAVDPDLERHRRRCQAADLLGRRSCCRASRSASSSPSRSSSSTGS